MIRFTTARRWRAWVPLALAGLLAACGGGEEPATAQPQGTARALSAGADPAVPVAAGTVRIHYQRGDAAYEGWGVYSWQGPAVRYLDWPSADKYRFAQRTAFGAYVDIPLDVTQSEMRFLVNRQFPDGGVGKAPDCDLGFAIRGDIASAGQEVFVKSDECAVYPSLAAASAISIGKARALWLQRGTIAWAGAPTSHTFRLYHAAEGGISVNAETGVNGADGVLPLSAQSGIGALAARYPHLAEATALTLPTKDRERIASLIQGQLVVVAFQDDKPVRATQVQLQGVIDDLYAADAARETLGPSFAPSGDATLKLFAPTAREVKLLIGGRALAMKRDNASGVWRASVPAALVGSYYAFQVDVWSRQDGGRRHTYTVTDPYAVSLDADAWGGPGQRALLANLNDAALKPPGWDAHATPAFAAPEDAVLYELHVRDFSASDLTVPATHRGKYTAFALPGTAGMQHLASMAQAGLTHVHLLPVYDLASINEGGCTTPTITNADPTSPAPQATVAATKDQDCFNWGYDPRHYGAPEGSYASDAADGRVRVREFRQMVQGLHGAGLRVVMDVVYNHTAGTFLDRIVPGYYYRLNGDGDIERSTCCENTATEFAMMEKLMTDTLVRWARDHRIDGFRFDIMGHIPKAAMQRAKAAVDAAVGPQRQVYFYGEAWNFGEVADDRLFVQARIDNMAGTGIGSFNDRIRDAVRGGGPFDGGEWMVKNQGFANGLCTDVNEWNGGQCTAWFRGDLHSRQQAIRAAMAGALKDFPLAGSTSGELRWNGQALGFTRDPQESINYAGVHDGETLYDVQQYKLPASTTPAQRARAQVVALAPVLLGQGMPFLHAGDELLRSKALDRDSYNAGDWFNRIDWTGGSNFIGTMGLPSAEKNASDWWVIGPVLANPNVVPSAADIALTREQVKALLRVRKSSTLFRLRSADDIRRCVHFPDAIGQVDGLIVMLLGRGDASCGDGAFKRALVVINAAPGAQGYVIDALAGQALSLHPVQAFGVDAVVRGASFDAATGRVSVPGRTVAVFVQP